MTQAKKKRKSRTHGTGGSGFFRGSSGSWGILLTGVLIGVLVTTLWNGWRSGDSQVGSEIQRMIEASTEQSDQSTSDASEVPIRPQPQEIQYDFFTVLPEIEVVVSEDEKSTLQPGAVTTLAEPSLQEPEQIAAVAPERVTNEIKEPEKSTPEPRQEKPVEPARPTQKTAASHYMLQAGSFSQSADAERQKARLALLGLGAQIQKVTIQGRGDFYRVRLGPYSDFGRMEEAGKLLDREGIQSIQLKVSRQ